VYFQNIIAAIGHTPLVELSRLNPNPGVRLFAKLEGQSPGGSASVKDRIVKYMLEDAERSGCLQPGKTLIEATSGNTGISLAWLGRLKGYRVTIVMPECMSMERRRLIQIMGAGLVLTPGELGMNGAIAKAREMAAGSDQFFMLDQFSNPSNPEAHYERTAVEILEDLPGGRLDMLVCSIGTGGTIVGLSRRLKEVFPELLVAGVEPLRDDPIQGLRCVDDFNMPAVMDFTRVDRRHTVTSSEADECARRLLEVEGIFAGVSSGAALCQSLKSAAGMDKGTILTILPDGGWKYLSLDLWDSPGKTVAV